MRAFRGVQAFLLLACFGVAAAAHAAHGDYAEAMRVRKLIQRPAAEESPDVGETIKLPTSRGFNQGGTQLCWSYATLNALETNWLVRHPGTPLELSRRTMQYLTMQDRYARKIKHIEDYISERGVSVDALQLLTANGLVAFRDFTDIADPYGRYDIDGAIAAARDEAAKLAALDTGLAKVYGVPPEQTHLDGAEIARQELSRVVLDGTEWQSYAVARDGREGWRTHPDPDARHGAQSYFMPASKIVARIKAALQAGYAVEITIGGHCILIYGATYDASGAPVTYFIKDSYPDYFYEANPASILRELVEMTTVKLPDGL